MIPDNLSSSPAVRQIRPATVADQQKIADLIFFESHVHRHLDWRTPLDWLGSSPYWVLEEGRHITGALACPLDPDSIAWIRLFAYAARLSEYSAWPPLWEAARHQLAEQGGATAAAIATQRWFGQLLMDAGFDLTDQIVLLEWEDSPANHRPLLSDITIRAMGIQDLPRVAEVDAAAFEPLWCNSLAALNKAFRQASYASVAENQSRVIGYQISTGGSFGAHLARLAVMPGEQGRGVGRTLVGELILHMQKSGGSKITVNTQADNVASLALYSRLGFRRTGEQYPVHTFQVK
jgi:ribosomal protein S18 acetylase RimI-like enzyme